MSRNPTASASAYYRNQQMQMQQVGSGPSSPPLAGGVLHGGAMVPWSGPAPAYPPTPGTMVSNHPYAMYEMVSRRATQSLSSMRVLLEGSAAN